MEKSLKSLSGLKNFSLTDKTCLIGKNTNSAVSSGIYLGVQFIIEKYYMKLKEKYPDAKIIFTGGDGKILYKKIKKGFYYEHLTIAGIQEIASKDLSS